MPSLRIDKGEITLLINDDPQKVLRFNPLDVVFAEKFYSLMGVFESKLENFQKEFSVLEADNTLGPNNAPLNLDKRIALMRESCVFFREQIDNLFGLGTSQMVFGDAMVLEMFSQFFEGLVPFVETIRTNKTKKYMPKQ